ncbi:MAG: YbjN domain-containing protein [Burkholderiaceae bacterium]|nr:YbjN domain-containing protein [Burkholderiaceae bacterium]
MSEALTTESATITLPSPKVEVDSNLQLLLNHLADEGFRPKIDDDGSLSFKCEGWKLYLDPYPNQGGFRLYCCVYWELDPIDRTKALGVANEINADRRCVKAVVNGNNTVWVTYETHCADVVEYARTVASAADFVVSGCREYREAFRRESQPVTLNA